MRGAGFVLLGVLLLVVAFGFAVASIAATENYSVGRGIAAGVARGSGAVAFGVAGGLCFVAAAIAD